MHTAITHVDTSEAQRADQQARVGSAKAGLPRNPRPERWEPLQEGEAWGLPGVSWDPHSQSWNLTMRARAPVHWWGMSSAGVSSLPSLDPIKHQDPVLQFTQSQERGGSPGSLDMKILAKGGLSKTSGLCWGECPGGACPGGTLFLRGLCWGGLSYLPSAGVGQ